MGPLFKKSELIYIFEMIHTSCLYPRLKILGDVRRQEKKRLLHICCRYLSICFNISCVIISIISCSVRSINFLNTSGCLQQEFHISILLSQLSHWIKVWPFATILGRQYLWLLWLEITVSIQKIGGSFRTWFETYGSWTSRFVATHLSAVQSGFRPTFRPENCPLWPTGINFFPSWHRWLL